MSKWLSILTFGSIIMLANLGLAGDVQLAWDPSPDPATDGYRLYYGSRRGSHPNKIEVGNTLSRTVTGLSPGVHYFVVRAYDLSRGVESSASNEVEVTVGGGAPTASFTTTATSGTAPFDVGFTDQSSGSVTSWIWNFGDGTSSIEQNPHHTYRTEGSYDVTLTVSGPGGADKATTGSPIVVSFGTSDPPSPTGPSWHVDFNDGSGNVATDASGGGRHGTIEGARWGVGQAGSALLFDGRDDRVVVDPVPLSMESWTEITVATWVKNDVGRGAGTDDLVSWWRYPSSRSWVLTHHRTDQYFWEIGGLGFATGGTVSADWAHVVGTYDGSALRLWVNGALVATRDVTARTLPASAGKLIVGGQDDGSNWFDGAIDDVRIYDRALDAQEIQALFDAVTAPPPDTTPAATPANVRAESVGLDTVTLRWDASSDVESGVKAYNVYRDDALVTSTGGLAFTDTSLNPGSSYAYEVSAVNGVDLESPRSLPLSVTTVADTTPPAVIGLDPSPDRIVVSFSELLDVSSASSLGSYSIPGVPIFAATVSGDVVTLETSEHQAAVPYSLTLQNVADVHGNVMLPVTLTYALPASEPALELRLDFVQGTGRMATDRSGRGNHGYLLNGASWDSGPSFGAVRLNGVDDLVFVESTPMEMHTWNGITVAAWVQNDAGAEGRTHDIVSFWDYPRSRSWVLTHHRTNEYFWEVAGKGSVSGGTVSTDWTHVVGTYDGAALRLYVGGKRVASKNVGSGALPASTADLLVGGQQDLSNFFRGRMGPVRVYSRALSATEITDLFAAGSPQGDTTPPSAPANVTAAETETHKVVLNWTASVDPESDVAYYNVYRDGVDVGDSTDPTFADAGLDASTTYVYEVAAVNGEGLESARSMPPLFVTTPSDTIGDPDLMVRLLFDEGEGGIAFDSSSGANDGRIVGATWESGAVRLDGRNDSVVVDAAPLAMDTWREITVVGWVRNDRGRGAGTDDIVGWWDYPRSRSWVLTHHRNNKYFWEISGKGYVTGGQVSTAPVMVVGTYDGGTLKLYVDGALVASKSVSGGALPFSTADLIVGGQANGSNWFDGSIDEICIYRRALTAAEIRDLAAR